MFQEPEVLNLILGAASLVIILVTIGHYLDKATVAFSLGLVALLASYLCTNLEVLVLPDVLNLLEHFFFAVAAVCFLTTAILYSRRSELLDDD